MLNVAVLMDYIYMGNIKNLCVYYLVHLFQTNITDWLINFPKVLSIYCIVKYCNKCGLII